jgi:hypothetical protein
MMDRKIVETRRSKAIKDKELLVSRRTEEKAAKRKLSKKNCRRKNKITDLKAGTPEIEQLTINTKDIGDAALMPVDPVCSLEQATMHISYGLSFIALAFSQTGLIQKTLDQSEHTSLDTVLERRFCRVGHAVVPHFPVLRPKEFRSMMIDEMSQGKTFEGGNIYLMLNMADNSFRRALAKIDETKQLIKLHTASNASRKFKRGMPLDVSLDGQPLCVFSQNLDSLVESRITKMQKIAVAGSLNVARVQKLVTYTNEDIRANNIEVFTALTAHSAMKLDRTYNSQFPIFSFQPKEIDDECD